MIDVKTREKIFRRIDLMRGEMVELQLRLTGIPALSPDYQGAGEAEKADFLENYLRKSGFDNILKINAPDERVPSGYRPNLLVTCPGRNPARKLWILTHTDIVPPGEPGLWKTDPYQGYVENDRIYGRGTEDNQQDLVASIFAAKAFLEENELPESSIGLAFVADEETSSRCGLFHVLRHPENPLRKNDLIVVPDSGEPDGSAIEIAEKSMLWLRFVTTGRQCHGSRPSLGSNALLAASNFIVALQSLHQTFPTLDRLYNPPESTFQPTRKESNAASINTIPGEDVFYFDCRILPIYDLDEVMAEIERIAETIAKRFHVRIDITPVQQVQAPVPTPESALVVQALKEAIRDVYRVEGRAVGVGAGTVAAALRSHGYEAAVWSKINYMAHQPNEYCLIDNMVGNAKVFAHMMLQDPG